MQEHKRMLAVLVAVAMLLSIMPTSMASMPPGFSVVECQDFELESSGTWGFAGNFTPSRVTDVVGGNATAKLRFMVSNQSGTRSATKTLSAPVGGAQVQIEFDWYPGPVNQKPPDRLYENGTAFNIRDGTGRTVFGLNNTFGAPLSFYFGPDPHGDSNNFYPEDSRRSPTGFSERNRWYHVSVTLDNAAGTIRLTLQDTVTGVSETHSADLNSLEFDGTVRSFAAIALRTSNNNITATQYLDNFCLYNVPTASNVIFSVAKLPYKTIYVGSATEDLASIGLPSAVTVTLADRSAVSVPVAEWQSVGEWKPNVPGIYEFRGILAETDYAVNLFGRTATQYVYNRLRKVVLERQTEWLDRGVVARQAANGQFVSWRLLADEYNTDITFNVYRGAVKLNAEPLRVTNWLDPEGKPGDVYVVESILNGASSFSKPATALATDYLSIPVQIPPDDTSPVSGVTASYSSSDLSVGDVDADGQYEIVVKWVPSNNMDSASRTWNNQTIFDCYELDGTLLWRMHMGNNLSSGEHYQQFLVADFDGDGKSEFLIKTADGTTVYGATDGKVDYSKVVSVIGNPAMDGYYMGDKPDGGSGTKPGVRGHVWGGPEYISVFDGETGRVIDSIEYRFSLENYPVEQWGDSSYNRSDRFLAAVAYLDGVHPSAVYCRGYYEKTTLIRYDLIDGKLVEGAYYDSSENGRIGEDRGAHSLSVADVDNDGRDEIVYGAVTFDDDLTVLYDMDGKRGRVLGSHGDALHVGAFSPYNDDGILVMMVHEANNVASMTLHDGATGETLQAYYANKDTGRGVAANITANPGYEFWGAAGNTVATGGALYNVTGSPTIFPKPALSQNFTVYWDGDLLQELLDNISITKLGSDNTISTIKTFERCASNNGTKAVPSLTADIYGDWREEVIMRTTDSSELRIYSTTAPTEHRIYTLMHDPVYRAAVARQNVAYNQPNHIGFYMGEDAPGRERVQSGTLPVPLPKYTIGILVTGVSNGNRQAEIDFPIRSANGKGYSVYVSPSDARGSYQRYENVNYHARGVHVRGLENGKTYYAYIEFSENGQTLRSNVVVLQPNQ